MAGVNPVDPLTLEAGPAWVAELSLARHSILDELALINKSPLSVLAWGIREQVYHNNN